MPGGNLAAFLHGGKGAAPALIGPSGHRRPLAERLERAAEVAAALAALEACGPPVLHRDVKPSNVFLDGAGRARLGDFGLARLAPASAATLTGETGTYLYMAPEMIRWVCLLGDGRSVRGGEVLYVGEMNGLFAGGMGALSVGFGGRVWRVH